MLFYKDGFGIKEPMKVETPWKKERKKVYSNWGVPMA